ncbi:MAG: cupin domain-containing protein [Phycisphaeraceae bacterium]
MRIINPAQIEPQPMQLDGAAGVNFRLLVGRDHGAPTFAMRHFTVAPGGHTPPHRHNYEHEVMILAGKAIVRAGETLREVKPGDVIFMPANEQHQFKNPSTTDPLVFICMVPVTFDCGNGSCQPTPGS